MIGNTEYNVVTLNTLHILLVSLLLYTTPDLRRSLTMLLGSLPWTLMAYTPLLNLLILCHRHTQLSSGLHAAIMPWSRYCQSKVSVLRSRSG